MNYTHTSRTLKLAVALTVLLFSLTAGFAALAKRGASLGKPLATATATNAATTALPFATITVNTLVDENGSGANCSLREAITAANTNAAFGGCGAGTGNDTIVFQAGLTGTLTLTAGNGPLATAFSGGDLTITGPGANSLTVSGGNAIRVLNVDLSNNQQVVIAGLTIAQGSAPGNTFQAGGITSSTGNGGTGKLTLNDCIISGHAANNAVAAGISSLHNLEMNNCTVSNNNGNGTPRASGLYHEGPSLLITNSNFADNTSGGSGGGLKIENLGGGTSTITNSTFRNNTAASNGGGMYFEGTPNVTVSGCAIYDNVADQGGGVFNGGGTLLMTNCTVTQNTSLCNGCGGDGLFLAGGATTLKHCTIVRNNLNTGGNNAVNYFSGTLTIQNNIIALQDNGIFNGFGNATVNSLGNNLISSFGGVTSGLPGPNDLIGIDPQLGQLGNNGGPTLTIRPALGSVVLDKAALTVPVILNDQRGPTFPRTIDQVGIPNGPGSNGSDIGAFELDEGPTFPCDKTLYYSQGDDGQPTQLYTLAFNNLNGTYTPVQIGVNNLNAEYNAIGFRSQDKLIYALEAPPLIAGTRAAPRLFLIDATGGLFDFGVPTGLPGGAGKYLTGAFGPDGFYYVRQQNQNTLYRINVTTFPATVASMVTIGAGGVGDDWAWRLQDNELYTVTNTGDLRRINPGTGANTLVQASAFPGAFPATPQPYGAVWVNAAGQVHALRNTNNLGQGEVWAWNVGFSAGFTASGIEGTFNDGCSCLDAPYLGKSDSGITNAGQIRTLTFRVVTGPTARTLDFTDLLPGSGPPLSLRFVPGSLAPPANPFGGTPNAYGNTASLTITGMNVPALTDATFTVQVQSLAPIFGTNQASLSGTDNFIAYVIPSENEDTAAFCDGTNMTAGPNITITSACINPGLVHLVVTANNPAGVGALTNLSIPISLFGGGALAPTPNATTTCTGGTLNGATAGATSFSLTGASLSAGVSSCRVEFDAAYGTPGNYTSSASGTASLSGTPFSLGSAFGTVDVVVPPTLNKAFNPTMINPGGVSQLTLTLNNLAGNKQIDSLAFTDNFPAGMTVAATPGLTNTCGGAVTGATAGSNSISLANGSLAAGATSCQITVNVTSTTPGAALNTINNLTGTAVGAVVACPALTAAPASATLTVGCPAIDTTITAPAAVCAGSTGNTASVPDAGLGATYAWTITNGTITSAANTRNITWTANSSLPVTLNVTVTPTPGCSAMGTQQVTVNPLPNATITAPAAVCVNSTGNTASVPDAGPGAMYNWIVNNGTITAGQGTRTITFSVGNSAPVGLSVNVTNASGCNNASSLPINLNPLPTANAGAPQTLCELNPGPTVFALNGSVTNATPQWSVFASTGTANASVVSPNSAATNVNVTGVGTVTLRLTATSNTTPACGTATSDVLLTVNPLPVTTITAPASVCVNSTGNAASVPDAGLGATYAWTITNGTITSAANSRNITWTAGATSPATLSVTVTTGAGCAANSSTQVTLLANPTANAGADQTLCQVLPGPTVFALNGTANGGTPAWSVLSSTGTANATIVTPGNAVTNVTVTGVGTVTLRLTADGGGCGTATDDIMLTINPNPTAAAGPDQSMCQAVGGPTAFSLNGTAANGASQWSVLGSTGTATAAILTPGNLSTGVNVTGTGTVTLRLTVTSNAAPSCGTATDDVVLTVNPLPSATITAPTAVCALSTGNPASVTDAGASATYAWTITNGTITSAANVRNITWTAGSTSPVTLNVTVTTGAGCGTNGAQQVTLNQNPTTDAGADQTLCQMVGGTTAFTLNGTVTNGTPQWSVQSSTGTANAIIATPNTASTSVNVTGIGTVTLRLTTTSNATPSCGTATDDVVLTVNPNPTANAGADQALCQVAGGPTAFTLNGTVTNSTPQWSLVTQTGTANANIVTPNAASTSVNVTGVGTVTLRLTTTSNATPSCGTATDDVVLTINPLPVTAITAPAAVCALSTGNLASVPDAGAGAAYNWTITGGTITAGQGSRTITWAAGSTSPVTLNVSITTAATCNANGSQQVLVNPNPTANAGPDQTLCQAVSGTTVFTLNGTLTNGTPQWSIVTSTGTANASIVTPASATTGVNVTGTGTVTLRLTVTSNTTPACGTVTDELTLTVNPNPTANAGPDQATCQAAGGTTGFTLNGAAMNGTPQWSVVNSTGTAAATIVNPASLTSGVNVTGLGSVTLRLTTTSNAAPSCGTVTDDVTLSVSLLPGTTITAPVEVAATSTGNLASVPDAGLGATYAWTITNGTITAGQGARAITFTAGASGSVTLNGSINTGSCVTTGNAVIPIRPADIRLTQTIAPDMPVKIAQPVSFIFTVTNRGELTATKVVVSNPLPAGFAFVAATPSTGTYSSAAGVWSVGTLALGASATLRIDAGVTAYGPYVNTGVATLDQPDINPADNIATVTANLAAPPGPGSPVDPVAPPSDVKAGSVLVYNLITSSATNSNTQNTRQPDQY
jgi:CSLREA domain-containing protein